MPATATVDVPRKPPPQIETTAWFVVSEALANAAKHSGAERAVARHLGEFRDHVPAENRPRFEDEAGGHVS